MKKLFNLQYRSVCFYDARNKKTANLVPADSLYYKFFRN